jgi:hypothetical protein
MKIADLPRLRRQFVDGTYLHLKLLLPHGRRVVRIRSLNCLARPLLPPVNDIAKSLSWTSKVVGRRRHTILARLILIYNYRVPWNLSHCTEKCRCQGCSGQETDILAIFEAATGTRFGLHFEVKQPADNSRLTSIKAPIMRSGQSVGRRRHRNLLSRMPTPQPSCCAAG